MEGLKNYKKIKNLKQAIMTCLVKFQKFTQILEAVSYYAVGC